MQNLSQTLFTTLLLLVNTSVFAAKTDRPNILLIMADDQGYGDTGFTGHPTLGDTTHGLHCGKWHRL